MSDQIYIGNFAKGLKLDRLPFVIDNDAFPLLWNTYCWRGRIKRKRGTSLLGQLQRQVQSVLNATPPLSWQYGQFTITPGSANLISLFGLDADSNISPGTVSIKVASNTFTDLNEDGTLQGSPSGNGTINYGTGVITISTGGSTLTGSFSYHPRLPVLGLEDFSANSSNSLYPILLAFDQTYSYQYSSTIGFYSTSYYKSTNNPVIWNGPNYSQFWTCNYAGALWATNNNPGFNFLQIATIVVGNPTTITTAAPNSLITGDYVWFNEITGTDADLLNKKTAQITRINSTTFTVPIDTTAATINNSGIFQTLTLNISGQDGIRWYDGDPTGGTGLPTGTGFGWVNFSPPLTATSVSINNTPSRPWYLVGALAILPFKDRLLFFNPTIGTSDGTRVNLQDTVIWSWNGTPYYADLVPNNQTSNVIAYYVDQTGAGGYLPAGISNPIITVNNNEDVLMVGFGGDGRKTRFVYTGNDFQPFLFYNINSELPSNATFSAISLDKGVLDIGAYGLTMTDQQSASRVDLDIPDTIFQIRSDEHGMQRVNSARDFFREWIYFSYPVETQEYENGNMAIYPVQTLLFNYRDNTWAILYENFTAHGNFRDTSALSWTTLPFKTWNQWRQPWNSGQSNELFPDIIAGNPQGYVLKKDQGTGESISGDIQSIAADGNNNTIITSSDHSVSSSNGIGNPDFLYIQGAIGITSFNITGITAPGIFPCIITVTNTFPTSGLVTISNVVGMTELNGNTYQIITSSGSSVTIDVDTIGFGSYISGGNIESAFNNQIVKVIATLTADTFVVDIPYPVNTYNGLGTYTRLSQPLMLTKQFPVYWDQGRQVRLSVQKYLMDTTADSQVTLNIYLSQNQDDVWNNPSVAGNPNGLIYSQIMYTCPESENIGLTSANVNLQMPTASGQFQIWHRYATSLVGNSFQIGITLNESQMKNLSYATDEIALHGIHLTCDLGPHLA